MGSCFHETFRLGDCSPPLTGWFSAMLGIILTGTGLEERLTNFWSWWMNSQLLNCFEPQSSLKKKIPWGCLTLVFPAADTLAHSPALYWQRSEDTIVPSLIYRRKLRVWVARLNHLEKEWFLWCDFMHLCASSLIINFGNAGGSGSPGCPWLRMPGKSGCLYSGVHRKNPLALETHDRVVLPNYVLYLSKNVSRENSPWEPHNLVALLQL